jgi:MFS family permease
MPEAQARSTRGESLWRNRDFLKLWAGQTVSLVGSQFTLLALPLAAILLFKATAFQVGVLTAVEFVPFLLFGLPVGVWVDRVRRKPLLVVADAGRFVVLGTIPLAYAFGVLTLAHLYAAAFATGVGTVIFDVAYGAYLPSVVSRSQLLDGNAKLETSRAGAQLAGPGLAGLMVGTLKAPSAILVDACSYLVSVASLLLIRRREPNPHVPPGPTADSAATAQPNATAQPPPPAEPTPTSIRRQMGEGIRHVVRHPLIRPIAICTGTLNLFGMMSEAVLLLFAVRTLGMSPKLIGLVLTVGNVGFLVGAPLASAIGRRLGVGPTLIGAAALLGLGTIVLALASTETAVALLVAGGAISAFGGVIYNVNARSLIQTITPDRELGRVIATTRFIVWGTIPLGSLLGGVLGTQVGLRATLWIGGIGQLAAFVPPLLSPVHALHAMPEPAPGQADTGLTDLPPAPGEEGVGVGP